MSKAIDHGMGRLDSNSVRELHTVDWRLAAVLLLAIQRYHAKVPARRIRVTEGFRSADKQEEMIAQGKSFVKVSHHQDGRAVDLAILKPLIMPQNGKRWEPLWELGQYRLLDTQFVQPSALELGFEPGDILWGGHWTTLRDGVHWQLMLPPL